MDKINRELCSILMLIRYCGIEKEGNFCFSGKKLLMKWSFLSLRPKKLKEFFHENGIDLGELDGKPNISKEFIRYKFGVFDKNFNESISKLIHMDLITTETSKSPHRFCLKKRSQENLEKWEKELDLISYKEILNRIKTQLDQIVPKKLYRFTDIIIKKTEKELGAIIKED